MGAGTYKNRADFGSPLQVTPGVSRFSGCGLASPDSRVARATKRRPAVRNWVPRKRLPGPSLTSRKKQSAVGDAPIPQCNKLSLGTVRACVMLHSTHRAWRPAHQTFGLPHVAVRLPQSTAKSHLYHFHIAISREILLVGTDGTYGTFKLYKVDG